MVVAVQIVRRVVVVVRFAVVMEVVVVVAGRVTFRAVIVGMAVLVAVFVAVGMAMLVAVDRTIGVGVLVAMHMGMGVVVAMLVFVLVRLVRHVEPPTSGARSRRQRGVRVKSMVAFGTGWPVSIRAHRASGSGRGGAGTAEGA